MPQTKEKKTKQKAAAPAKQGGGKSAASGQKQGARRTAKRVPAPPVRTKRLSNEIKGILVIAVGLFFAAAFFTNATGIVGSAVKNVVGGLFGGAAYFFFLYIIWTGINFFLDKRSEGNGYKYWLLAGMMLFSGVLAALICEDTLWEKEFFEEIRSMYNWGASGFGGGVLGGGLCRLAVKLIGVSGTWIVTVAVMLTFIILLTGVSLERLLTKVLQMIKKHSEQMAERARREVPMQDEPTEADEAEVRVAPSPNGREKKRKKADPAPAEGQERYGPITSDYFELYFSAKDIDELPVAEAEQGEAEPSADGGSAKKFRLELDSLPQDDEGEEEPAEADADLPFERINIHTGTLTELPNENGEFIPPVQNEEGTDYEPPSDAKLQDVLDPDVQQALNEGVPLDRAAAASRGRTVAVSESLAHAIDDLATESVEATKLLHYKLPPLSLLSKPSAKTKSRAEMKAELEEKANRLLETLTSFKVEAKILNVTHGPSVTRFELQPGFGVKVSKITGLADDIALALAANGVRIEAPIPGKSAIGIEIPNQEPAPVTLREVLDSEQFRNFKSKTAFALGKDIAGNCVVADVKKFPHILIAGATGSGKSVCINSLIASILYKAKPNEVKMIMVDPKKVELEPYNGIPHLLIPVVTDPKHAAGALNWAVAEMNNRYKLFQDNKVRNLRGFNEQKEKTDPEEKLPEIIIIIDEFADLMMTAKNEVEDAINRLAALARAAGMYLVLATQRPSVDVITGVIKANIPSRIALSVSSQIDSRTIIDTAGAEKLLGRGDMLYAPSGAQKPIRVQGDYISDEEIEALIRYVKNQYEAEYDEDVLSRIEQEQEHFDAEPDESRRSGDDLDSLFFQAAELAVDSGQASVAMLQRRFKIGYQRAARIVDQMEEKRVIGPYEGTKPRQVLLSRQELYEMQMNQAE